MYYERLDLTFCTYPCGILYLVQKKEKLYTGITTDLSNRLRQHGNPPLLYSEKLLNKFTAAKREKEIKGWSRHKKLELIAKFNK